MPRIWSGNLTFSLVSIAVTAEAATSSHKIGFRQVHREDMGRVKYRKTCELDDQVLEADEIGRAFEAPGGQLVEISDDELDEMPLPTLKTIEVSGFVELAAVPPEQLDKPFFLTPSSPAANKPYALMRDALARSGKAAVGKLAMRGSERLALVHAHDQVLVLHLLHWPDELRSSADAAPRADVELSDEEIEGALALIESMSDVRIKDYRDQYAEAVVEVINAKIEGAEPPRAPAASAEKAGGTVDLMAALQASVSQAHGGEAAGARGGRSRTGTRTGSRSGARTGARASTRGAGKDADVTHLHEKKPRKAAAKKTASQGSRASASAKTGAKKTAAKKTDAKATTTAKKTASRGKRAG
jgi:DNA end-binding protein Ku